MLVQPVAVTSPVDADLRRVVARLDPAPLAWVDAPPELVSLLRELVAAQASDADAWVRVARFAVACRLGATAALAYRRAADAVPLAGDRAALFRERADWLRASGYDFAAAADERVEHRLAGRPSPPGRVPELESEAFAVVCAQSSLDDYTALLALAETPLRDDPLRDPFITKPHFLASTFQEVGRAEDFSFFVVDAGNTPRVQVECDVAGSDALACRNTAVTLTPLGGPMPAEAEALALRQLAAICQWAGASHLAFETRDGETSDSLDQWLAKWRVGRRRVANAWVDLAQEPARILAGFRQTHRQQTRWGLAHLTIVSSRDQGDSLLAPYLDLQARVSRRAVVGADEISRQLAAGEQVIHIALLAGEPVAAVAVTLHGTTAYYSAGLRLDLGGKPLTHALVYTAMLDARAHGFRRFDFGILHIDPSHSAKLRSIALHKQGFTDNTRLGWWESLMP